MSNGRRFSRDPRTPQIRINHRIRVPEVRVVAEDGSNLGVLATGDAIRRAQEAGLDLVEVNPKGTPPVCKILDFGKYKYEEKKKQRETKRKQTVVEVKEIKLRPKTDDHDMAVKVRAARRFAEAGNKVKFTVRFRGREITHPEVAQRQIEYLLKQVEDLCNIEQHASMEGRAMAALVSPKPAVMQRVAQDRAQREKDREKARAEGLSEPFHEAPEGELDEELHEPDDDDDDDDDEGDEGAGDAGDEGAGDAGDEGAAGEGAGDKGSGEAT